jgi:ribosome-associated protein
MVLLIKKEEKMKQKKHIPPTEYKIESFKASGPGGQNVNKTSTGKRLRFNIGLSKSLTKEEKEKIRKILGKRITKNDEILIESTKTRSAYLNEKDVIEKFHKLINEVLKPEKTRIPTQPTKESKEKRLKEKKHRSEIKKLRRPVKIDD